MTKKIEGVSIQLGNRKWRFSEEPGAPMATEKRATLVISDERVFTESEVRDLLRAIIVVPRFIGDKDLGGAVEKSLRLLIEQYGITLDPA